MSENWDFYFAYVNDKLASLLVDLAARQQAPNAELPWLLWAIVYFQQPRDDGLSSNEESDRLYELEDALTTGITAGLAAQYVGRITVDGRREYYFYAPSFAGFDEALARSMEPFAEYQWESGSTQDAEWQQYLELLFPSPRDWQRIKNRRVLEALEQHGDKLEGSRMVHHWAYFETGDQCHQFVSAVSEQGFEVTRRGELDEKPDHQWQVVFEREDRVDWDSINNVTLELFELARTHGGKYDGWETMIIKP